MARREKREERLKKEAAEKAEREKARERSPPRREPSHSYERKDRYGGDNRASYGSARDNRYDSRDSRGYGRDHHQTGYGRDQHQSGYGRSQPQQCQVLIKFFKFYWPIFNFFSKLLLFLLSTR